MIKLYDPIFDIFRELAETHLQCVVCSELFVDAVRLEKVQGNFLMIWGKKMKNIKRHVKKNWILFTLNLICSPLFIISPNWANKTLTKYLTSGEKNFKRGWRGGEFFKKIYTPGAEAQSKIIYLRSKLVYNIATLLEHYVQLTSGNFLFCFD